MALPENLPLPDFERVTSSATVIVDEFRKLPNVAVFHSSQVQAEILTTLRSLTTSIQALSEKVTGLQNNIYTLNTEVNTLRTDLTTQISTLRVDMNNGFGVRYKLDIILPCFATLTNLLYAVRQIVAHDSKMPAYQILLPCFILLPFGTTPTGSTFRATSPWPRKHYGLYEVSLF